MLLLQIGRRKGGIRRETDAESLLAIDVGDEAGAGLEVESEGVVTSGESGGETVVTSADQVGEGTGVGGGPAGVTEAGGSPSGAGLSSVGVLHVGSRSDVNAGSEGDDKVLVGTNRSSVAEVLGIT